LALRLRGAESEVFELSRSECHGVFMTDEDFKNLEHDVVRHEGDLDQQLSKIQSLEKQLSELKKENAELQDSLSKTVILAQRIFVFIRTDKLGNEGARLSNEIVDRLRELHTQLKITRSQ
jgi:septal ring factor EnvC (AmiA/AmiB activator)